MYVNIIYILLSYTVKDTMIVSLLEQKNTRLFSFKSLMKLTLFSSIFYLHVHFVFFTKQSITTLSNINISTEIYFLQPREVAKVESVDKK